MGERGRRPEDARRFRVRRLRTRRLTCWSRCWMSTRRRSAAQVGTSICLPTRPAHTRRPDGSAIAAHPPHHSRAPRSEGDTGGEGIQRRSSARIRPGPLCRTEHHRARHRPHQTLAWRRHQIRQVRPHLPGRRFFSQRPSNTDQIRRHALVSDPSCDGLQNFLFNGHVATGESILKVATLTVLPMPSRLGAHAGLFDLDRLVRG
jgi:hypothetical protein